MYIQQNTSVHVCLLITLPGLSTSNRIIVYMHDTSKTEVYMQKITNVHAWINNVQTQMYCDNKA